MSIKKTRYGKIIIELLEESYQSEIIDTLMEDQVIGEGKDYATKEDWIEYRLEGLTAFDTSTQTEDQNG